MNNHIGPLLFLLAWLLIGLFATVAILRKRYYPKEIHFIMVIFTPAMLIVMIPELLVNWFIRNKEKGNA